MKFLIMGSCGMAGHVIAQFLLEKGHDVTGFARTESLIYKTVIGDALDKNTVNQAVFSETYDVVVNCIGILNTRVDTDLDVGIYINSYFPHYLAKCCDKAGSKLIHISTDCVFNGNRGSYTEDSIPDEVSFYGRTKSLGEVTRNNQLTLRTSIIGPELKENGIGLFHWFMNQKEWVNGYRNVMWSGVTTIELADAIEKAAKEDVSGLYHLCNNEKISKYDLLGLFNNYCRKEKIEIRKEEKQINDKSLVCTRKDFSYSIPSYEQMVKEMAIWINNHKEIYNQYMGV